MNRAYLAQKGVIMTAISRFIGLVNTRTQRAVDGVRASNHRLSVLQIVILCLIVLVGLAAMAVLSRVVVGPLARLVSATRRIAGGDQQAASDDGHADGHHNADEHPDGDHHP